MQFSPAFKLLAGLLALAFLTSCVVDLQPETDTNPVGTSHTVTATIEDPFDLDLDCDELDEFERTICLEFDSPSEWVVVFEVISGPNVGKMSSNDCVPSCSGSGSAQVSWSYIGDGGPGEDTIIACTQPPNFNEQAQALILQAVAAESAPPAQFEELFCSMATKTWVEQTPTPTATPTGTPSPTPTPTTVTFGATPVMRNVGGFAAAVVGAASQQARENRAAAAATPVPAAAPAFVAPPSTGDAGLPR